METVLAILQILSGLAAMCTAYAAYRARDNARAVALCELRAGQEAMEKTLRAIERRQEEMNIRLDKHIQEEWEKRRGIA